MAHFVRTQPDGVWVLGYRPTYVDIIDLDNKTLKAINGDAGGTWTPSSGISVGGAGVQIGGQWDLSSANQTATGQITFGNGSLSDYFLFEGAHPETDVQVLGSCSEVYAEFPEQSRLVVKSVQTNAFAPATAAGVYTLKTGARFACPLRVRSGGSIVQIDFHWLVGQNHANIPATLPRFRAFAVDASGNVFPLKAPASDTDNDGFQTLPTPASAGAYNNGNAAQEFIYVCDQNQLVDISKYSYFVEFIDESGTNAWTSTGNTLISTVTEIVGVLLDQRS